MDDKNLIEYHGGSTKLAAKLGYDADKGGVQRVNNWKVRGIPSAVKIDRPDLFLKDFAVKRKSTASK